MIIVLHNVHLEPINVIELPSDVYTKLLKSGSVKISLENNPKRVATVAKLDIGKPEENNGCIYVIDNEIVALAIKPHWLPGQQVLINCYQEIIKKLKESKD